MTRMTIVGWNASRASEAALDWAVSRELEDGGASGQIVLVTAMDYTKAIAREDDRHPQEATRPLQARWLVEERAARVAALHPGLRIRGEVMGGTAEDVLSRWSSPDVLIVVGGAPPSRSRLRSRQPIGERLAARSLVAVAVIPPDWEPGHAGGIVVGVDGTASSRAALRFGEAEAQRDGVGVAAVHAWPAPAVWDMVYVPADELRDIVTHQHDVLLEDAVLEGSRETPDVPVERRSIAGDPYRTLVHESAGARMLVVGSHSHGTLVRRFLGSVSATLVAMAPLPVVVVHPDAAVRTGRS
ncbi:nucleotide-binding universal stress UspA family protein [Clavibacter michiganensis]|uniref:universal stress protein n=1 Tax=Clavibacter michiganensis TaxID=28447 RepID=UPI001AE549C4|nr:universal stress protein [Clavibacter michiganensis]MBP2459092.1 nucleotide-binding universal stress UspA family protein [Clavibacter michiganensis]MDQ0411664.1 nucleotide-binding universal stress UspA family protein [Clavibacter michiganensis]